MVYKCYVSIDMTFVCRPVFLSGIWSPLFISLCCHCGWSALWLSQTCACFTISFIIAFLKPLFLFLLSSIKMLQILSFRLTIARTCSHLLLLKEMLCPQHWTLFLEIKISIIQQSLFIQIYENK